MATENGDTVEKNTILLKQGKTREDDSGDLWENIENALVATEKREQL